MILYIIKYIDKKCVVLIEKSLRNDNYYTSWLLRIVSLLILLILLGNVSLFLTIRCSFISIKYFKETLLLLVLSIFIISLKKNGNVFTETYINKIKLTKELETKINSFIKNNSMHHIEKTEQQLDAFLQSQFMFYF